ncbi:MAG: hypothetical protein BZY87_07130 [SAR202 cluster bacterium Io17-Chloro-G6]|nr:MAG: hypothetical protein BZY87_07130 [SAR202 cluster bacterium Io17-Chloro-G6]
MFWGALALGLVLPWLGGAFISAHRSAFPADGAKTGGRLSEGDRVNINVSLKNRFFYPRFFHSVKFASTLAGPHEAERRFFVAQLPSSSTLLLESTAEVYMRGLHHLGPVILESSAPFGLFRRRRTLAGPQTMLVLPRVYPLNRLTLVDGQDSQSDKTRVSRSGLNLAGSRPYVPGDSPRMVHWRNTARAGRMMVKETEDESDKTLHIMFDSGDVWGEGRDTNFEYAIKLAVTVADYALKNGVPVRVWGSHLNGAGVASGASAGGPLDVALTWNELLESLAIARPAGRVAVGEGLASLPTAANLFIVVSANDETAHQDLRRALVRSRESIVVRLEGFGEPATNRDAGNSPEMAGASVLTCGPGGLARTLSEIENMGQWDGSGAFIATTGKTSTGAVIQ